jgi:hypothetical protein
LIAAQPEIGSGGYRVGNVNAIIIGTNHLTTLLRGVIFFREPLLGSRFDLKRMGLPAVRNDDQIVMGRFGALRRAARWKCLRRSFLNAAPSQCARSISSGPRPDRGLNRWRRCSAVKVAKP